jgi:hypothetical protein
MQPNILQVYNDTKVITDEKALKDSIQYIDTDFNKKLYKNGCIVYNEQLHPRAIADIRFTINYVIYDKSDINTWYLGVYDALLDKVLLLAKVDIASHVSSYILSSKDEYQDASKQYLQGLALYLMTICGGKESDVDYFLTSFEQQFSDIGE